MTEIRRWHFAARIGTAALFAALAAAALTGGAAAQEACPQEAIDVATTPVPMQRSATLAKHRKQMEMIGQPADIVLFGDSLSEGWDVSLPPLNNYKAVNLGLGADTTQNVLWRIDQIQKNALDPSIVIVFAGTNNLGAVAQPCGVAAGILAVLDKTHALWPKAHVIYFGMPPRGKFFTDHQAARTAANAEVAAAIASRGWAEYIDLDAELPCGLMDKDTDPGRLLGSWFTPLMRCGNYKTDGVHLTPRGYQVLSEILARDRTQTKD